MPANRSISIVVPTYREAANIPALAERVHAALSGTSIEWELLLAGDASDDGSEAIIAELARRLPIRMETRREPPRDLSRSVLFGMRRARFDRVVVMDADLSHPPERIVDLLRALDDGCDMALGSRYAPGGGVDRAPPARTPDRYRARGGGQLPARDAVRLPPTFERKSDPEDEGPGMSAGRTSVLRIRANTRGSTSTPSSGCA